MHRHRMSRDAHGAPVLTITVTGEHDIHRLADQMCRWQSEFARTGRLILRSQRRRMGRTGWLVLWHRLHGSTPAPRLPREEYYR